jgi:hypothetical protein|tara:strand:- start:1391 stop:1636 length:246 start_codon:yes stop_codon:yes gene_type:complete
MGYFFWSFLSVLFMSQTDEILVTKSTLHNWDPDTLMKVAQLILDTPSYKLNQDMKDFGIAILMIAEFNTPPIKVREVAHAA